MFDRKTVKIPLFEFMQAGENLLLTGPKATGKNILAENLAYIFHRLTYNVSFHVNTNSGDLIGTDTFKDNEVKLRKGSIYQCAEYGGFLDLQTKAFLDILEQEFEEMPSMEDAVGRLYDVILNHPNAKNPKPYQGKEAVVDTATEVRHLRNLGVSVLGVFAGEEKNLATEKKIFGKDFAYIRDISKFSKFVGRYLTKQLENDV